MNEKPPQSRGNGDGSTVVVAAVLTVVVVLLAVVLVCGVFFFYFAVPVTSVGRPASPNAVTTAQNAVTTTQYDPVEIQEDIGEAVVEPPLATDVGATATEIDAAPEEADGTDVGSVAEEPEPTVTLEADPAAKPSDMTPPTDETVKEDTVPPADEPGAEDSTTLAEKEKPESGDYQSLPRAFERDGMKADGGDVPRSVAFAGRKCESVIWAQPDEDEGVSQVSYMLDGKYATLRGTAGISDADDNARLGEQKPSAVFRIYGDGNLLWESNPQLGFGAAQYFEIEVKGIEVLSLTAESSSSSESSRFAWGDVKLKATKE